METDSHSSQFDLDISHGETRVLPRKEPVKKKKIPVSWFFLGSAGQIGFAITVPLLAGIAGGIWIEKYLHIHPAGVFGGLALGMLLSIINLVRTVQEIIKQ